MLREKEPQKEVAKTDTKPDQDCREYTTRKLPPENPLKKACLYELTSFLP